MARLFGQLSKTRCRLSSLTICNYATFETLDFLSLLMFSKECFNHYGMLEGWETEKGKSHEQHP